MQVTAGWRRSSLTPRPKEREAMLTRCLHDLATSLPLRVPSDLVRFPLNLIDAVENKEMGRAFDHTHCRYEVRFMSSLSLREDIRPATQAPISISARPTGEAKPADKSLEGVLLFSGIGFALMMLAAIFGYLQFPPPVY
jgi:hypothetical protein